MSNVSIPLANHGKCSDSPLSTAASITGILTFAYAVIAGTLLYLQFGNQILQASNREVYELSKSQREIASEIEESKRLFQDLVETLDCEEHKDLKNNASWWLRSAEVQTSDLVAMLEKYRMGLLGPGNRLARLGFGSYFVIQKDRLLQETRKRDEALHVFRRMDKKLRKMFDLLPHPFQKA